MLLVNEHFQASLIVERKLTSPLSRRTNCDTKRREEAATPAWITLGTSNIRWLTYYMDLRNQHRTYFGVAGFLIRWRGICQLRHAWKIVTRKDYFLARNIYKYLDSTWQCTQTLIFIFVLTPTVYTGNDNNQKAFRSNSTNEKYNFFNFYGQCQSQK